MKNENFVLCLSFRNYDERKKTGGQHKKLFIFPLQGREYSNDH